MRLALVLNPRSGSITDPDALVEQVRSRCDELTVHAPGEHDEAIATGPDRLLVAGGDGTIAACFAAAAEHAIPLAVLPAGTANDFARALGLPLELDEAVELATLLPARTQATWGGTIDDRPFVNVASIGLAVEAADVAEDLKPYLGPLAYGVGALRAGVEARPVRAGLVVNDASVADGRVWQLLVGASGRFGGGSGLGEAEAGERSLVAAWVPAGTRLTLPFRALGLRNRTIERQPGVRWWRGHHLIVHASQHGEPTAWNIDGERWEPATQRVELRPLGPVEVVVGRA
ncbi:MAG: diacylglycerol kinase family protein [Solirubrobacteraceae bacterium]